MIDTAAHSSPHAPFTPAGSYISSTSLAARPGTYVSGCAVDESQPHVVGSYVSAASVSAPTEVARPAAGGYISLPEVR
jgi:hypothetical protein